MWANLASVSRSIYMERSREESGNETRHMGVSRFRRHHLFYAFVALGFSIFLAGLALVPGYLKPAWVLSCMGELAILPSVLSARRPRRSVEF